MLYKRAIKCCLCIFWYHFPTNKNFSVVVYKSAKYGLTLCTLDFILNEVYLFFSSAGIIVYSVFIKVIK